MTYFSFGSTAQLTPAPSTPGTGQELGYVGSVPDPTPNLHYTLPGVLAGLPTPETTRGRCQIRQPCVDEDIWES